MAHTLPFGAALLLVSLLFAGCTAPEDGSGDDLEGTQVEVGDSYFEVEGKPETNNAETTAAAGDTFIFEPTGDRTHSITVHRPPDPADEYLKDDDIRGGDPPQSFTFDQAGTYHIWCKYHGTMTSGMHLTVNVT